VNFFSKLFKSKLQPLDFFERKLDKDVPPDYIEGKLNRDLIIEAFVGGYQCGIELERLGVKDYHMVIPTDLSGGRAIMSEEILNETDKINRFILRYVSDSPNEIFWFQINVDDQAINEYAGPKYFESVESWVPTILDRLNNYRADQSGDTILVIFSSQLKWAVSFCLSQDHSTLSIERFVAAEQHPT
jgi:hypothetical protein